MQKSTYHKLMVNIWLMYNQHMAEIKLLIWSRFEHVLVDYVENFDYKHG
jgi:hypothetical protein